MSETTGHARKAAERRPTSTERLRRSAIAHWDMTERTSLFSRPIWKRTVQGSCKTLARLGDAVVGGRGRPTAAVCTRRTGHSFRTTDASALRAGHGAEAIVPGCRGPRCASGPAVFNPLYAAGTGLPLHRWNVPQARSASKRRSGTGPARTARWPSRVALMAGPTSILGRVGPRPDRHGGPGPTIRPYVRSTSGRLSSGPVRRLVGLLRSRSRARRTNGVRTALAEPARRQGARAHEGLCLRTSPSGGGSTTKRREIGNDDREDHRDPGERIERRCFVVDATDRLWSPCLRCARSRASTSRLHPNLDSGDHLIWNARARRTIAKLGASHSRHSASPWLQ